MMFNGRWSSLTIRWRPGQKNKTKKKRMGVALGLHGGGRLRDFASGGRDRPHRRLLLLDDHVARRDWRRDSLRLEAGSAFYATNI